MFTVRHMLPSTWRTIRGQKRLRWAHDEVMTTHRTDICTGKASHEQLALPDGGRITFWNRACCLFAERKSCRPTDSPFLYFPVCVPQSFKAASFIYNLFVLAVVCQCFFLRHFLPSAHLDQWFFSYTSLYSSLFSSSFPLVLHAE